MTPPLTLAQKTEKFLSEFETAKLDYQLDRQNDIILSMKSLASNLDAYFKCQKQNDFSFTEEEANLRKYMAAFLVYGSMDYSQRLR